MFENSTYSEFRGPQTTSQFTQWWLVVVLVKYYVVVFCFGPIIFVGLVGNLLVFMLLVITDHKEEPNASSLCIRYTILANIVVVVLGASNHFFSSLIKFGMRDSATWACQGHYF